MYEENNSQDKPVVIGIDHGFSLMKTKHHILGNGVVRCNGRPPVAEKPCVHSTFLVSKI